MVSQTLFSDILTEAINRNPQASPEDILEGLVNILETEILPSVIRDLRLPPFPSWAKMAIKSRGRKSRKKFQPTETLRQRRAVIQQVEYLKKLNWDGVNTPTPAVHFSDHDDVIGLPQLGMSFEIETRRRRSKTKFPIIELPHKPYARVSFPLERKNPFVLSDEVQERVVSDPLLEGLFKNVEISIRELIETRGLEACLSVSFKSDLEIPTWEKYVIKITLPPRTKFEERMKIWEIFDLTIRNKILELAKKADDKTREYLESTNKNLYVHMEL